MKAVVDSRLRYARGVESHAFGLSI